MLSPTEAAEIHAQLVAHNLGRPIFVLPVRIVVREDGSTQKLPKCKWDEAASDARSVEELWDQKAGGWVGIHLARSGLVLADQDVDATPPELDALLDDNPTFTSRSLSRGLPHRWYAAPDGHTPRDRRWTWRGFHVGDLKSKGIGVLGTITSDDDFAPLPDDLDAVSYGGEVVRTHGDLKLLVTAWMAYLDHEPTVDEILDWVKFPLRRLATAVPGERNNALYQAARDVAHLCSAGALSTQDGARVVFTAAQQVFDEEELRTEVRQTIQSAFERESRGAV